MFNLCTEFTVGGICLVYVLCLVLSCFITFIFNIFATSYSMYIVMIEKKAHLNNVSKIKVVL